MTAYYSIILARDQTIPNQTIPNQTIPDHTRLDQIKPQKTILPRDHPYNPDRYGLANLTTLIILTKSKDQEPIECNMHMNMTKD